MTQTNSTQTRRFASLIAVVLFLAAIPATVSNAAPSKTASKPHGPVLISVIAGKKGVNKKLSVTVRFTPGKTHRSSPLLLSEVNVGPYKCIAKAKAKSCVVKNVPAGKTYKISVRSRNKNGYSKKSQRIKFTVTKGSKWRRTTIPGSTPTSTIPGSSTSESLKFDLENAVGVMLTEGPNAGTAAVRKTTASPTFSALGADGTVWNAIASGKATIDRLLIAPNDKLYAFGLFQVGEIERCRLIEVDRSSGNPVCVEPDSKFTFVKSGQVNSVLVNDVQFDSAGAIYYMGHTTKDLNASSASYGTSDAAIVRRYLNGVRADFGKGSWRERSNQPGTWVLTDPVRNFLVLPDGGIIIDQEYQTFTDEYTYDRKFQLEAYVSSDIPKIISEGLTSPAIRENQFRSLRLDENRRVWVDFRQIDMTTLALSELFLGPSDLSPIHALESLGCAFPPSPEDATLPKQRWICSGDTLWRKWFSLLGRSSFALFGYEPVIDREVDTYPKSIMLRLTPTPALLNVSLAGVSIAMPLLDKILMSGTNQDGKHKTVLYDPVNEQETEILSANLDISVLKIDFNARNNQIWFTGLRQTDDTYVVGNMDASGDGQATLLPITNRILSLETFSD